MISCFGTLKRNNFDGTPAKKIGSLVDVAMTPGEVLDRLSILDIKRRKLSDEKAKIAESQYETLRASCGHLFPDNCDDDHGVILEKYRSLVRVNEQLWGVEDEVRKLIRTATDEQHAHELGFTSKAALVPVLNDERAKLKNEIDEALGSETTEVKGYV
jgi:hypothetical protein